MLRSKPKCMKCATVIEEDDIVCVKMGYLKRKSLTEIKAYLHNEGKFICENCFHTNAE